MTARLSSAVAAAEVLIIAAIIGIGAQTQSIGLVAFGSVWLLPVLIDRIRREA